MLNNCIYNKYVLKHLCCMCNFCVLGYTKQILQKSFGNHVKNLRISKGLTQITVSSNMGKDQQSLQRVESGNVSPSLFYLFELSAALDISICELMTFEIKKTKKRIK